MTIYNREDSRAVLPQLEKKIDSLSKRVMDIEKTPEFYSKEETIDLGYYLAAGLLTSSSGYLLFSIPTGRVFPQGTTISKMTCTMCARASSANGSGYYIVKKSSGGTDHVSFNSTQNFTFYNANNASMTLAKSKISVVLYGGTNVRVQFTEAAHFFSGNSTITNYINNNACTIEMTSINITLNIPKEK